MKNILLEICVGSVQSSLAAEEGGAKRVELCDNLWEGGTTPSIGSIELARENITIDLNVLVRPRGGDFCYSDLEFDIICSDVLQCKAFGANGVVVGFLLPNGDIDLEKMKKVMELANPMSVTFHRAFDVVRNPETSLKQLIELGVDRILTSGQKNTAYEGRQFINKLVKQARDRIIIMPGSGVNPDNIEDLVRDTGAVEFHSTGRALVNSKMQYTNPNVHISGLPEIPELDHKETDPIIVAELLSKAKNTYNLL